MCMEGVFSQIRSHIRGPSNRRLFSHYQGDYLCKYVQFYKEFSPVLTGKTYLMASNEKLSSEEHFAYHYHSHTQC